MSASTSSQFPFPPVRTDMDACWWRTSRGERRRVGALTVACGSLGVPTGEALAVSILCLSLPVLWASDRVHTEVPRRRAATAHTPRLPISFHLHTGKGGRRHFGFSVREPLNHPGTNLIHSVYFCFGLGAATHTPRGGNPPPLLCFFPAPYYLEQALTVTLFNLKQLFDSTWTVTLNLSILYQITM